jgi:hypothetical protein
MAYHRNNSERRLARLEADKARSAPPAAPPSPFALLLEELRLRLTLEELKRLRDLCRDAFNRGFPESLKDPVNGGEVSKILATARARTENVR